MKSSNILAQIEEQVQTLWFPPINVHPILILTPSENLREAHRETLTNALAEYKASITSIRQITAKLDSLDRDLSSRTMIVQTALAPISALPQEILKLIFGYVVDMDGDTFRERTRCDHAATLSHVSSSWRDAAVSYQSIWTEIVIQRLPCDQAVSTWVKRSGTLPLSLDIRTPQMLHGDWTPVAMARLHKLSLSHFLHEWLYMLFPWDKPFFPELRHLELRSDPSKSAIYSEPALRKVNAPKLSSLNVTNMFVWTVYELRSNLKVLAIHIGGVYFARTLSILSECSSLMELSIISLFERAAQLPPATYNLSSLGSLALKGCRASLTYILRSFNVPNLRNFSFRGEETGFFEDLEQSLLLARFVSC